MVAATGIPVLVRLDLIFAFQRRSKPYADMERWAVRINLSLHRQQHLLLGRLRPSAGIGLRSRWSTTPLSPCLGRAGGHAGQHYTLAPVPWVDTRGLRSVPSRYRLCAVVVTAWRSTAHHYIYCAPLLGTLHPASAGHRLPLPPPRSPERCDWLRKKANWPTRMTLPEYCPMSRASATR